MPANGQPPTDAQPEWMRSFQAGQPYAQYNQYPQYAPNGPNGSGNLGQPPLPQQAPSQQYPPAYQGYGNGAGAPPSISVGSLVNEDALPEWLRNAANSGALPPPMPPAAPGEQVLAGNGWENTRAGQPSFPPQSAQASGPLAYGQPRSLPPSPVGSGNLVASSLFDESALPEWLRAGAMGQSADLPTNHMQAQPGYGSPAGQPAYGAPAPNMMNPAQQANPATQTGQPPVPPPSSAFPGIEQAGAYQPPAQAQGGLSASSLLDANALPQWLSGRQGAPAAPARDYNVSRGLQAGSLIDENALPQWLRNEPPTPASQQGGAVPPSYGTYGNNGQMPSWLNQGYQGYAPPAPNGSPVGMLGMLGAPGAWNSVGNGGVTGQPMPPSQGGIQGMMGANELVDESALPEWLRTQSGMMNAVPPRAPLPAQSNGMPPVQPIQAGSQEAGLLASGSAAGTFSASDLIDPNALPEWVRGANAAPPPTFSSTSGWTNQQPATQAPNQGAAVPYTTRAPAIQPRQTGSGALDSTNADLPMDTWHARVQEPLPNNPGNGHNAQNGQNGRNGRNGQNGRGNVPRNELPSWLTSNAPEPLSPRRPPRPPVAGGNGSNAGNANNTWDDATNAYPGAGYHPNSGNYGDSGYDTTSYAGYGEYGEYGEYGDYDQYDHAAGAAPVNEYNGYGNESYEGYENGAYGEYDEEYPDYDGGYGDPQAQRQQQNAQQERRGGWRRFFGRK